MPRIWQTTIDVDRAIETIARYLQETGKVPDILLEAYRESIQKTSRGLTQRFYERLAEKCPEAMKYF